MRDQVVPYQQLKTMENYQTISPKKWLRSHTEGGP